MTYLISVFSIYTKLETLSLFNYNGSGAYKPHQNGGKTIHILHFVMPLMVLFLYAQFLPPILLPVFICRNPFKIPKYPAEILFIIIADQIRNLGNFFACL